MNVYISGSRQFSKKGEVYDKSEILRETGYHPVTISSLVSRFKALHGRQPSESELFEEKLEALSNCGGNLFLQNKNFSPEIKYDYEYAKEHNLVVFDIFRLSPYWR